MNFSLPDTIQNQIRDLANQSDIEICGYWVPDRDLIIPATNTHKASPDKPLSQHFKIDGEYHAFIIEKYPKAVIYHSHIGEDVSSILSHSDIESSKKLLVPYLTYHKDFEEWDYFDPLDLNPYPLIHRPYSTDDIEFYLGIPWQWDRFDCYSLFRNYYSGMLGIKLRDFSRKGGEGAIFSNSWNQYVDNYESQGFVSLPLDSELFDNDVLLMTLMGEQIHHAIIVVDAAKSIGIEIIGEGRVSEKVPIGQAIRRRTKMIIRHKNFQ